jgi:hypothetical protein
VRLVAVDERARLSVPKRRFAARVAGYDGHVVLEKGRKEVYENIWKTAFLKEKLI